MNKLQDKRTKLHQYTNVVLGILLVVPPIPMILLVMLPGLPNSLFISMGILIVLLTYVNWYR